METIMTNKELAKKAIDCAKNYKTLYVMGCFGAPMNAKNKKRYKNNNAYNRQPKRQKMIEAATDDTFGFDCVCLVKGLCWGWSGDKNKTYGGAVYASHGLPDISIATMKSKKYATGVSTDFKNIEVGELLYISNSHMGIYVGDGLAVEATPAFKNKVQITAVSNIGKKSGYSSRKWDGHFKANFIKYESEPEFPNGNYKIKVSKTLRKTMSLVVSNRVKVKECDAETKKLLTSTKANAIAMFKVGVTVPLKNVVEKDKRKWMQYKNYYIVVQNQDGTNQVEKVK